MYWKTSGVMALVEREPILRNWYCDGCVRTTLHVWTGVLWKCGTPGCARRKEVIGPVQKLLDFKNRDCTMKGKGA